MSCTHHWKLPTPNGPTVLGTCCRCGAEREFRSGDSDGARFAPEAAGVTRKRLLNRSMEAMMARKGQLE